MRKIENEQRSPDSRPESWPAELRRLCEDQRWWLLAAATFAALTVRIITLTSFSKSIYGTHLMPDEQVYDRFARAFFEGKTLPPIIGFSAQVPGYLFSLAYSLFGAGPSSTRTLNVALGTATCILLYFAGEAIKDRPTGLLSAAVGALYGPFILASVTAEKTAFGLFLIGLSTALGIRAIARPRTWSIALCAFGLALSSHVRGNALVLVIAAPIAFAFIWRRRREASPIGPKLLAYCVGLAVVLVPLARGGILGTTEQGFALYFSNTLDNPTPYYRPVRFAPSQPDLQGGGFALKASLDEGRTLSAAEARAYYVSKLREEWIADPGAALGKLFSKLSGSLNAYEHAHNHNLAFVSQFVRPLAFPWIGFSALFALALVGAVLHRREPAVQWLSAMAIAYWMTLVMFFSDIRLRAPLALLLVPLAAIGLQEIVRRRPSRSAILAFGLGIVLTHIPVPGAGDMTTANNLHALMLFESGDYDGAEKYYEAAHALPGLDADSALLGLSAIAARRGDLAAAQAFLAQLDDGHYKAAEKYVQLGNILVQEQKYADAARALQQAIEIDPGLLPVYPLLEMLDERLSAAPEAARARQQYDYANQFFVAP
jgi:tetratricopeptide (TPR) repeat protein